MYVAEEEDGRSIRKKSKLNTQQTQNKRTAAGPSAAKPAGHQRPDDGKMGNIGKHHWAISGSYVFCPSGLQWPNDG